MGDISSLAMPDQNMIQQFAAQPLSIGNGFDQALQASRQQQLAKYQLGVQLQQAQQLQEAKQAYIANPTPQNFNTLATLDPSSVNAIKAGHEALDLQTQKDQLRQATYIRGLIASGDTAGAQAALQQRIDADNAAGLDTSDDQQMADLIQANPKAAGAAIDYHLASILGPDKFAENFKTLGGEARATAEEPGNIAHVQAETALANAQANNITNPRPETAATTGADGNPIFYNKNAAPPVGAAGATDSPALSALVPKLIGSESGGDPNAKNPNSSATGAGQFLSKTWVPLFKQLHPELTDGKTDAQILAMRSNPQYAAEAVAAYARQNADTLGNAGLPVNGATIAMAHKLGPGGAQAVLGSDPNAQLSSVLPADVIKANPQLAKLTAGQYANGLAKQFGTDPINAAPDPSATGDEFLATLPPGRAKLVKAIANGDAPMPTGRSATTGAGQALMSQVLQYDPTASALNLQTRQTTRKAFTTGPEGQSINSANTLIGHLVSLKIASDQLNNGGVPAFNAVANAVLPELGNQDKQSAISRFNTYRTGVANELTKVFRGSNGAEADVQGWLKQLSPNSSPTQIQSTIGAMLEAMNSRLESLGSQYSQGMGKSVDGIQLLTPHAQQQLKLLEGSAGASAPKVAINPQTGQKVVYDPASRSWKPA